MNKQIELYYSTGTSSTATHIAFEEAGIGYKPIEVSWSRNLNVADLERVNPLGAVPTVVTANGKVLRQNLAVMEYVADLAPEAKLIAAPGTFERNEIMSWLSFAASDLQRAYAPLFASDQMTLNEAAQSELEAYGKERVRLYLSHLDQSLRGKTYIVGEQFSIADCYLFTVANWAKWFELSFAEYKNLVPYLERIGSRPAVRKVLENEDLLDWVNG